MLDKKSQTNKDKSKNVKKYKTDFNGAFAISEKNVIVDLEYFDRTFV